MSRIKNKYGEGTMEDFSMRKASFRRLIALFLTLALLLPVVSTMALAIGEDVNADATAPKVDASVAIKEALDDAHKVFESVYTDEVDEYGKTAYGYCGFEVKVTTYVKNKATDALPNDSTMIAYVINTRIGKCGNTVARGRDIPISLLHTYQQKTAVLSVSVVIVYVVCVASDTVISARQFVHGNDNDVKVKLSADIRHL